MQHAVVVVVAVAVVAALVDDGDVFLRENERGWKCIIISSPVGLFWPPPSSKYVSMLYF